MITVVQELHRSFLATHHREHELGVEALAALEAARTKMDAERDIRYQSSLDAVRRTAMVVEVATKESVAAALESVREANTKLEIGVEKRGDAVYVTLTKLQDSMAQVMPRAEAESRFGTHDESLTDVRDRLKSLEAMKVGAAEQKRDVSNSVQLVATLIGILLGVMTIVTAIVATSP